MDPSPRPKGAEIAREGLTSSSGGSRHWSSSFLLPVPYGGNCVFQASQRLFARIATHRSGSRRVSMTALTTSFGSWRRSRPYQQVALLPKNHASGTQRPKRRLDLPRRQPLARCHIPWIRTGRQPASKKVSGAYREDVVVKLCKLHEHLDTSVPVPDDRLTVASFLDPAPERCL
jgi:hypothetical protein